VAALTSSSSQNSTAEAVTDDSTNDSTVQIHVPSTSSTVPDREAVNTAQNAVPSTSSAVPDREAVNTAQNPVPSTSSAVPDREAVNTVQIHVPSTGSTVPDREAVNTAQNAAVPSTSSAVPDRDDDEAAQQTLAYRTTQIRKRRVAAYSGQVRQAERVVKRTRVELKAGVAGDNVAVPIPLVDRGRGDPRNILGVIVNRNLDTYQYTIAVKTGVLHSRYFRNQFDLCPQRLLTLYDVN